MYSFDIGCGAGLGSEKLSASLTRSLSLFSGHHQRNRTARQGSAILDFGEIILSKRLNDAQTYEMLLSRSVIRYLTITSNAARQLSLSPCLVSLATLGRSPSLGRGEQTYQDPPHSHDRYSCGSLTSAA
jgi:hypothetical protein